MHQGLTVTNTNTIPVEVVKMWVVIVTNKNTELFCQSVSSLTKTSIFCLTFRYFPWIIKKQHKKTRKDKSKKTQGDHRVNIRKKRSRYVSMFWIRICEGRVCQRREEVVATSMKQINTHSEDYRWWDLQTRYFSGVESKHIARSWSSYISPARGYPSTACHRACGDPCRL